MTVGPSVGSPPIQAAFCALEKQSQLKNSKYCSVKMRKLITFVIGICELLNPGHVFVDIILSLVFDIVYIIITYNYCGQTLN